MPYACAQDGCVHTLQPESWDSLLTDPRSLQKAVPQRLLGQVWRKGSPHSGFLQSKMAQYHWNRRCLRLIDSLLWRIFLKSVFCFVSLFASPYKNRTLSIYKSTAPWLHAHDAGRKPLRLSLCFSKPWLPDLRVPRPQESMWPPWNH